MSSWGKEVMKGSHAHSDRRHSFRVTVDGLALLWCKDRIAGRYRLADLSIGGCLLRDGPTCDVGAEYGLVLHLPTEAAMRLPARVVRQRTTEFGRSELGIVFLERPPWTEDQIHDLVMRNLEREHSAIKGRVLVVDANENRRDALVETLLGLGCDVLEAATPVEAVWELENGPMDIHTAFIARTLGRSDGRDLVRFIGARYANVWRVLMADGADLHRETEADAVLSGPLDLSRLRKALPDNSSLFGQQRARSSHTA
jgi:CheY-like chemotaxis protein